MQSILSIHDVMPKTMSNIKDILQKLPELDKRKVYLLVVPGLDWSDVQITQLKQWQNQGYQLAGHGWTHKIIRKTSLYHYLHSFFISRDVAEHLSLTSDEVRSMVQKNYDWFLENGFNQPDLYVPPAWAMGKLSKQQLSGLPFRYYESSTGLYDSQQGLFKNLPLTGYEADRNWRKPILRAWNWLNVTIASSRQPLRISIHPFDMTYPLARDIIKHIGASHEFLDCDALFKQ